MNFQQLRSVRETVRQGFNLTEVANVLFTSQPGVSRQIRELEEELGVPLVERGHRFTGFTAEGEMILEHAKRILAEIDTMGQSLSDVRQGLKGRLDRKSVV